MCLFRLDIPRVYTQLDLYKNNENNKITRPAEDDWRNDFEHFTNLIQRKSLSIP
jgi:hypothetical protein